MRKHQLEFRPGLTVFQNPEVKPAPGLNKTVHFLLSRTAVPYSWAWPIVDLCRTVVGRRLLAVDHFLCVLCSAVKDYIITSVQRDEAGDMEHQ
jgi:hypothetical protein